MLLEKRDRRKSGLTLGHPTDHCGFAHVSDESSPQAPQCLSIALRRSDVLPRLCLSDS
jgi:hypothetical protein